MINFIKKKLKAPLLAILKRLLGVRTMSIGELYQLGQNQSEEIYCDGNLKFVESSRLFNYRVLTPEGFIPIKQALKTVPYAVWEVSLEDGYTLKCADLHIINTNNGDKFAQDLVVDDLVNTDDGVKKVLSVNQTEVVEEMFDLELEGDYHHYYTNGIVSHNTTISGAHLLYYAMMNENVCILVVSYKSDLAKEVIKRIKFTYEQLPMWLKPGVTEAGWNKHSLVFDNGSSILSQTTSENSGRGLSITLLFCHDGANTVDVMNEDGIIEKITLEELYAKLQ